MQQLGTFRAGFDVGNVILRGDTDKDTQLWTQDYVKDSVKVLTKIVRVLSQSNAFIISKCGPKMQARTLDLFESTDFYSRTGFNPDHVLFCRQRHEKAGIAADLDLNQFTDDRMDVLRPMVTVEEKLLLQREDKPPLASAFLSPEDKGIYVVQDWHEIWERVVAGL